MNKTLRSLMDDVGGGKDNRDEIFAGSVVLMALMEDAGWDIKAFSGTMAAYFCPDEKVGEVWLAAITAACDEHRAKVESLGTLLERLVKDALADGAEDAGQSIFGNGEKPLDGLH